MIIVGLTGSIGMGKSTTAAMFRALGAPVYDADAAVHRLYAGAAVEPVGALFPAAVVDGRIDRRALSAIVLGDAALLKKLESVVHPLLGAERADFLAAAKAAGARACVLDIPLLFETGGERHVDVVAVVSASRAEQERRVLARGAMSAAQFAAILAKQTPDPEKRRRAHCVIDTGRGLAFAERQVKAFLRALV